MNELEEIQKWYHSQCNGDWEHSFGVSIENLDNPGWLVRIDLEDTSLENVDYKEFSYGIGEGEEDSGDNWISTKIENKQFVGCGGPYKLREIFRLFLNWSNTNA